MRAPHRFLSIRLVATLLTLAVLAAASSLLAQPATNGEATPQDSGPGEERPFLNSERIERRFGSYGIEVLENDAHIRVSHLYSLEEQGRIGRTFAVVHYPAEVDPAAAEEHALILEGGSIGAVFSAHGWEVARRHLWIGEIPSSARVNALMGEIAPASLAVHVFELVVSRDAVSFPYAVIAEVHHPDHLTLEDLQRIFGAPPTPPASADAAGRMLLLTLEAMHAHR